jgi:hypothetical protein
MQRLLSSSSSPGGATNNVVISQPREINGQVQMVVLKNGCSDCFNCINQTNGSTRNNVPGSKYGQRTDNHLSAAHTTPDALQGSHRRASPRRWATADECSEVNSSEEYERQRAAREAADAVAGSKGVGGRDGSMYGGNSLMGARRPKTQCRISSQRGLTSRRRVIRLLVAVVCIFAVCTLPYHVKNLLHYWNLDIKGGVIDILSPVSSVLMYLNCGLNPLIYWMFSDHFRRSLKETLCFWKKRSRNSSRLILNSPRGAVRNSTFRQ